MKAERTELEIENGLRLFDFSHYLINQYLNPERSFSLRPGMIVQMQEEAVRDIQSDAGQFRSSTVRISGSRHSPPAAFQIEILIRELCEYINDNWHEKTAFYLSAYAMWRINWIHAFSDGNGRTARTLSYVILCIKLGYILPGTPTIPEQIEQDKTHYIKALEAADEAEETVGIDVRALEEMLKCMLAKQLLSVIEQAGENVPIGEDANLTDL